MTGPGSLRPVSGSWAGASHHRALCSCAEVQPQGSALPGCRLPGPSEQEVAATWDQWSQSFSSRAAWPPRCLPVQPAEADVASASQLSAPAQARLRPGTRDFRGGRRTSESVAPLFSGLTSLSAPRWSFEPWTSLIPHLTPAPLHPLPTGALHPLRFLLWAPSLHDAPTLSPRPWKNGLLGLECPKQ